MHFMMRYLLPFRVGVPTSVSLPAVATVRGARMGVVTDMVELWCELPVNNPALMEKRRFWIVGTGYEVPDRFPVFVQTVFDGPYAWHIYTTTTKP